MVQVEGASQGAILTRTYPDFIRKCRGFPVGIYLQIGIRAIHADQ